MAESIAQSTETNNPFEDFVGGFQMNGRHSQDSDLTKSAFLKMPPDQQAATIARHQRPNAKAPTAAANDDGKPDFHRAIFGDKPGAYVLNPGFEPKSTTDFPALIKQSQTEGSDLWFHVGTLPPEWHANPKHATNAMIVACPYLWIDADAEKFEGTDPKEAARHFESEGVRISQAIDRELTGKLGITPYLKWRSGAGWQCLIKLDQPVAPSDVSDLIVKLHAAIGFDGRAVQDPRRLLRVPGGINWKDGSKDKRHNGRVPSPVGQLRPMLDQVTPLAHVKAVLADVAGERPKDDGPTEELTVDWSKVNESNPWLKGVESLPPDAHEKLRIIVGHTGPLSYNKNSADAAMAESLKWKLIKASLIMDDHFYGSWSEVTEALAAGLKLCKGWTPEWIAEALGANLRCNEHITKYNGDARRRAILRAINHAYESKQSVVVRTTGIEWRDVKPGTQIPTPTIRNTILALENVGITARRDVFHHMTLLESGDISHAISDGEITDAAIRTISVKLDERFKLDFGEMNTRRAIEFIANENQFDPLLDMLVEAQGAWDGVTRLDTFAIDYLNCADDPAGLNRYIGKLMLVAAVRRARHPGCKCDYVFTLLSDEGWNKSGFFEAMAGSENFSDERTFGLDSKNAQEQLTGIWWHENGELQGLSKADIDSITTYASRTTDRARPAYGYVLEKRPRRSIEVGSSNLLTGILRKQTGNRRWLILELLKRIDLAAIRRDRMQLLGEAAALESKSESIMLPEALWPAAGEMQEAHREPDDWEAHLEYIPATIALENGTEKVIVHSDEFHDRIASTDLLSWVLKIPIAQQRGASMRVAPIMKRFGWTRGDTKSRVIIDGKQVKGYERLIGMRPAQ